MFITQKDNDIVISDVTNFNLYKTFESGQCFRWNMDAGGGYIGVFRDKVLKLYQEDNNIILKDTTEVEYENIWKHYFDLDRDYSVVDNSLMGLPFIGDACAYSKGIRILKQDPWETLISFIISQNNNIPRIKLIIERLCRRFGHKLNVKDITDSNDQDYYSFPAVGDMKDISIEDIAELKCGFRDKYIVDAVSKVSSDICMLDYIYDMDLEEARVKLMEIKGVGRKVADCTLLYGFGRMECFPIDVWIKRTLDKYFLDGFPNIRPDFLGIVQQYIFYYVRSNPNVVK